MPDRFTHETFHGKLLDLATITALQQAEHLLDYELTILQGIGGAEASAGTHLGGRAVDLAPWDHQHKVKVLKRLGFAVWHREALAGEWGEHIHAVLILDRIDNDRGIAPPAFRQIGSFLRGHDGLADDGVDPSSWRADPQPVYHYPPETVPARPKRTAVSRTRNRLVEAQADLLQAAALLDDADHARVKARKMRDEIRKAALYIDFVLGEMPKR